MKKIFISWTSGFIYTYIDLNYKQTKKTNFALETGINNDFYDNLNLMPNISVNIHIDLFNFDNFYIKDESWVWWYNSSSCSVLAISEYRMGIVFFAVLRIRIRKILTSWIRIRIRIQGVKYQPRTAKKNLFTPKTQTKTFKKREYKNFLISEWFIKF